MACNGRIGMVAALAMALALPAAPAWGQAKGKGKQTLGQLLAARRAAEQQRQLEARRKATELARNKKKEPGWDKFYGSTQKRQNLPTVSTAFGSPLEPVMLDAALIGEIGPPHGKVADELFLRRVYLSLIGELPAPADLKEFAASTDPAKREKVVDQLLALPQFGKNLARRWHDAISYRNTAGKNREITYLGFENWLTGEFNKGTPWSTIVGTMLTTTGEAKDHPEGLFFGAHGDNPVELAGETARLFLGMQLACAQCHDHPNEHWKRDQFHELAAFFGRTSVRFQLNGQTDEPPTTTIGEKPARRFAKKGDKFPYDGEYYMPDLKDPAARGTKIEPMFLTGKKLPPGMDDAQRRKALAGAITAKSNPMFAKAFVNHAWTELVGSPFTEDIDDLADGKSPTLPKTFDALAKSFAASNYDIKKLYRLIALSVAFGGEFGEPGAGDSDDGGVRPVRLASTQVFDALSWALGDLGPERGQLVGSGGPARLNGRAGVAGQIEREFGFDPALDAGHLDASVPQALLMMNHPTISAKISAKNPQSTLGKVLKNHPKDADAIEALFLRTLARRPTSAETHRTLSYLTEVKNRPEAFEDLFWALLNTAEFIHHR